jgi:DNA-binding transcriptional LysR family regulator
MELRHLRYFLAVAEELNIRRAATRLNISHPPVSRQIQDLEQEVGVPLIIRGKRGVTLTQAGLVFLEEARLIVAHAAQAIADARDAQRGLAGRLRISYSFGYLAPSLAKVVKRFREKFPKVKIDIHQLDPRQQMEALQRNTVDIAYAGLRFHALQEHIHFECIHQVDVHIALPLGHKLLRKRAIALSSLADQAFVSLGGVFYDYRSWLERLCAGAGFRPKIVHEADTSATMFGLVSAGFGIALLPALHDPPASEIEFRPISPELPKFDFNIAWRRNDTSPALLNFIAIVRQPGPARTAKWRGTTEGMSSSHE